MNGFPLTDMPYVALKRVVKKVRLLFSINFFF